MKLTLRPSNLKRIPLLPLAVRNYVCTLLRSLYQFLQGFTLSGAEGGQMYPVSWTVFLAWACISIQDVLPPLVPPVESPCSVPRPKVFLRHTPLSSHHLWKTLHPLFVFPFPSSPSSKILLYRWVFLEAKLCQMPTKRTRATPTAAPGPNRGRLQDGPELSGNGERKGILGRMNSS